MAVVLNPYLSFDGDAREAMEFYKSVFGGELSAMTFADFQVTDDPALQDKLMHSQLEAPGGLVLMGSDTPPGMTYEKPQGVSISLSGDDEAALRGYWEKLSEGGQVTQPLSPAPWGDTFGSCVDRFGIVWLVDILGQQQG